MRVVLDREGGCLFEREAQQRRGHIIEGSLFKKGGHNRQGGYQRRGLIRYKQSGSNNHDDNNDINFTHWDTFSDIYMLVD